jgi:hypothetical protein
MTLRTGTVVLAILGIAVIGIGPASGADDPGTCGDQLGRPVAATIVGTDGPDVLVGTPANDVIWARARTS